MDDTLSVCGRQATAEAAFTALRTETAEVNKGSATARKALVLLRQTVSLLNAKLGRPAGSSSAALTSDVSEWLLHRVYYA